MKILLTTIFQYPHEGGMSTHISMLKKGLEKSGHQVTVLSSSDINKVIQTSIKGCGYLMNRLSVGAGQLYGDLGRMNALKLALRKIAGSYDVINTQDIFATIAAQRIHDNVVLTLHGYYSYEATSRGALKEGSPFFKKAIDYEKEAYESAGEIICVDNRLKEHVKRNTKIEPTVIKNFIDPSGFTSTNNVTNKLRVEYNLPDNKKIILVPRRLTEKNGVIYPLLALEKLITEYPDILLVYAGTGEMMDKLKQLTFQLDLKQQVRLLGSVPHQLMPSLYQLSNIVVVPSIHSKGVEEATSISALEGMLSKTPVIAGAVGGLKELITHNENGLLFSDRNIVELAVHIRSILNDQELREKLTHNAYEHVLSNHTVEKVAEEYLFAYKKNQ
ncbi:glycosyltransferase family 1 protein [Halalkalibacillus sediminis]|uniref:Glycosyltransferase family 1 protein n=1 Tax=Halalkalibacillus sediminis TaxID=2018042 RepID=A0A2I0QTW9_9BACI|nr:glycosyltransferase family 4 protein [Halalkalibacillus sediminis]PKR77787.1 glycosyltransferase family 1 protein [Halalkalibacillus sediminis]